MPSSPRYDVVVVGGGLAGIATATWLAKRGRAVALIEPRGEWGGGFADQRLGSLTVAVGPRAAVNHERQGWAEAYFEAIGLSLPLMVREGTIFRREPIQVIWGTHRLTIGQRSADFAEELRREYQVGEPDVAALLADLESVYNVLAIHLDPLPSGDVRPSLGRLRSLAAARAFLARFGHVSPAEYARARGVSPAFGPYLESWRSALTVDGEAGGRWLFRTALVHRGLVSLPKGRAGICQLLVARFQSFGGEVIRTSVGAIGTGKEPFVDTEGRRLHGRALVINGRGSPGRRAPAGQAPMVTAVYTVPGAAVPEAMGSYLLVADGGEAWSLARGRAGESGAADRDVLTVSFPAGARSEDPGRFGERLEGLLPFAAGQLALVGAVRDDELPDALEAKHWESLSWRTGGDGCRQVSRAPVWWLPDESLPWLDDAGPYRVALRMSRELSPT